MSNSLEKLSLDDRIAAAFADGVRSEHVAQLIVEAEAAATSAIAAAESARMRALDPTHSALEVSEARRETDEATFRRDRMQEAVRRLGERLREVKQQEVQHRRQIAYDRAKADRDRLAEELARVYPRAVAQLTELLQRVEASNREIESINARDLPSGSQALLVAELVARGMSGFVRNNTETPSITRDLRLPVFRYEGFEKYVWPCRM